MSSLRRRVAAPALAGTIGVAAVWHPLALVVFAGALVILLLGVVLPAVWSRKPQRRTAALAVIDRILALLRTDGRK